jgi:hypothetical protein
MREESPQSLWDRVMQAIDGWMGEDGGVDESTIAFHLVFIAPIFLALVLLSRR